ncbi:hypothetical protein T310_10086, partial [Rasamsonia emersonii CBS 393.64]
YENSQQKKRYGSRNVLILKLFTVFMLLTPISVILDARLSFTVVKGVAITLAFASKEELTRWAKLKLPDSSELRKKCEVISEWFNLFQSTIQQYGILEDDIYNG